MYMLLKKNMIARLGSYILGPKNGCFIDASYTSDQSLKDVKYESVPPIFSGAPILYMDDSRLKGLKRIWLTGQLDSFILNQNGGNEQTITNWTHSSVISMCLNNYQTA